MSDDHSTRDDPQASAREADQPLRELRDLWRRTSRRFDPPMHILRTLLSLTAGHSVEYVSVRDESPEGLTAKAVLVAGPLLIDVDIVPGAKASTSSDAGMSVTAGVARLADIKHLLLMTDQVRSDDREGDHDRSAWTDPEANARVTLVPAHGKPLELPLARGSNARQDLQALLPRLLKAIAM